MFPLINADCFYSRRSTTSRARRMARRAPRRPRAARARKSPRPEIPATPLPRTIPARSIPRSPERGSEMPAAEVWPRSGSMCHPADVRSAFRSPEVPAMPGSTARRLPMSNALRRSPNRHRARRHATSSRLNSGDRRMQQVRDICPLQLHKAASEQLHGDAALVEYHQLAAAHPDDRSGRDDGRHSNHEVFLSADPLRPTR